MTAPEEQNYPDIIVENIEFDYSQCLNVSKLSNKLKRAFKRSKL